jgi:hypothetical protein
MPAPNKLKPANKKGEEDVWSSVLLSSHQFTLTQEFPNISWHQEVYYLTYSWSSALLEKLPIVQPLKNFPTFYGTRRFITALTRALHWSLS